MRSTARFEAKAFVWGYMLGRRTTICAARSAVQMVVLMQPGLRSITKAILSAKIWVDSSEARINGQTISSVRTWSRLRVVQHGSRPRLYIKRGRMWELIISNNMSQHFPHAMSFSRVGGSTWGHMMLLHIQTAWHGITSPLTTTPNHPKWCWWQPNTPMAEQH